MNEALRLYPPEEGKDEWIALKRGAAIPGELQRMHYPSIPTNRQFYGLVPGQAGCKSALASGTWHMCAMDFPPADTTAEWDAMVLPKDNKLEPRPAYPTGKNRLDVWKRHADCEVKAIGMLWASIHEKAAQPGFGLSLRSMQTRP